jgi:type IV pilus assembly protein PilP
MKVTSNLLKYTAVVFLVLSMTLWAYTGYCDDETSSYGYNPKGKQDPFKPFMDIRKSDKKLGKSAPGSPPGESVPRSPLQKISIDQLRLVGIIWSDKKKVAIVEDTKGEHHHYVLHIGTRIGMNAGRVVKILPDGVIVEEKIKSPSGKIKGKQVVLKLRTEENGGRP